MTEEVFPKTGRCRKCDKALTGKQTSWCSRKCSKDAFAVVMARRGSSSHMRKVLQKRDKEICNECGLDCAKMKRIMDHAKISLSQWKPLRVPIEFEALQIFGFYPGRHTWEVDHIIEYSVGGSHDLDNLQTLCLVCHKRKTNVFNRSHREGLVQKT